MFIVTFSGPFGFIKPWTAVRDGETYSQQFLTPSIIKGLELKLFPELLPAAQSAPQPVAIIRHRLLYAATTPQQEVTQAKGLKINKRANTATREKSILIRGLLIKPRLTLAFVNEEYANRAASQHICLCRNEDILLPESTPEEISEEALDQRPGFELLFGEGEESFLVGYSRYANASPMYGTLRIYGDPFTHEEE